MRAAAQPSARASAASGASRRRGAPTPSIAAANAAAAVARLRAPVALAPRRPPRLLLAASAAASASASASAQTPTTPSAATAPLPAPNPRPPAGTAASFSALAAAHTVAALALAASALLPSTASTPLLTSCLSLGPASSLMAPALAACLAAASARAAGLSLFVRSAAAAAEGVAVAAAPAKAAATTKPTQDAEDDANDDDNDVTALNPLPTELRTWRYQRPNAALLAFGACSALAHTLGLVTAVMAMGSSGSTPAALLLPTLGLTLSLWTSFVAARTLKWAAVDASLSSSSSSSAPAHKPSGSLFNIAFACEPLAEALGGAEDVVEDRRIVAAEIQRQEDLDMGLKVMAADDGDDEAATTASEQQQPPRPVDLFAAARACLAYLARDLTTFQGLALTLTWVASLGCFVMAVVSSLVPWPRALPAVAAAAKAVGASSASSVADPALTYLLAAAGVASLPLIAAHAHALAEHAAYTRRLDIPATLRATLLARLTKVARRRRIKRGREVRGLVLVPGAVVDVELEGQETKASAEASTASSSEASAALFPPPPHNAPPSRFSSLRLSFAAASGLQLIGLVGLGASSAANPSDPRFVSAQAAARAALDASDPAMAALTWVCLLGALWSAGQLFGLDFKKVRAAVTEVVQLASKVVDLVVRGLFWDAYWVMQNRVVH